LSVRPTECRYCRYPATKGGCHGNHFLASIRYNLSYVVRSDTLFDVTGGFSGSSYQVKLCNEDSLDRGSKGRCHGNLFWDYIGYKWPLTGDNDMGFCVKDG